jgi:hypothetical protein
MSCVVQSLRTREGSAEQDYRSKCNGGESRRRARKFIRRRKSSKGGTDLPADEAGILFAHGLSSLSRTPVPSRSEEAPHEKELPSTDTPRPMPHALTVSMAGLRTCGSVPHAAFPVAQWLLCAWLAAYRSGGCRGFG